MDKMTIERAVEVLNRVKHRGFDCWRAVTWRTLTPNEDPVWADSDYVEEQPSLSEAETVIIASWYEGQAKPACPDCAHEHDGDRIIYFGDPG